MSDGNAAGACWDAVEQAVLLLGPEYVAQRARRRWASRGPAGGTEQSEWFHMFNDDIISMPDKWEYPWYAAWDLAFHMLVAFRWWTDFAKEQLQLNAAIDYIAPERSNASVRVELQRYESAGSCVRDDFIYIDGKDAARAKGIWSFSKYAFTSCW